MSIIFYLLAALFVTPAGIYFYFFYRRFLTLFGIEKKTRKSRGLSLGLAVVTAAFGIRMFNFSFIVMIHFLLACFAMELANLVFRRLPGEKFQKIWTLLYKSGILALSIAVVVLTYGYFNMHHVQRTDLALDTAKALEQPIRILQISDLHTGTTLDMEEMKECFARIESENGDLLVLTGDIFDETTTREQMEEAVRLLSQIDTTYGTYFIFGNHDANLYTNAPAYTADQLRETLTAAGIQVLEDDVVKVTEGFTMIGRQDRTVSSRASIESLAAKADKKGFLLLLDHQPVDLEENAKAGIDLELAGHTHGGQIFPMGILSKLAGINEEFYGLHAIGDFHVFVSSGTAGWGYPIRTEEVSEYVVVDIQKAP